MATIINNSLTADENILRINDPYIYVADPDKGKPLKGAQLFFGEVGRDPELEENQKLVYALQEDGSAVPIPQPVLTSAGGVPTYANNPVALAISGAFSYKVLDDKDAQVYYQPRVENPNMQGFSGVVAEESQTVSGSLTLSFTTIEAVTGSFYKSVGTSGTEFEGSYLRRDVDYRVDNSTTITLLNATADGTVILGRQMDPTGQVIPVAEGTTALFVFQTLAEAINADLQAGDTITINGESIANDGLGGAKFLTVLGQPEVADGENIININNGNQIQAIENVFKFARYSEDTTKFTTNSSTLSLDLENGQVFTVTLDRNISDIDFLNLNPDPDQTTTVSVKLIQDGTGGWTVNFPAIINWNAGAVPTVTSTPNAYDRYVFVTDDGGVTWDGFTSGQDFQ